MNEEILFDAPNVVRLGMNLLYQVSNSGNEKERNGCRVCFRI